MKARNGFVRTPMAFALLLMVSAILFTVPALAGQQAAVHDGELIITGDQQTGQPVAAVFDLKGYELPTGSYASVNVRFADRPDGEQPSVKTGYPRTTLLFHAPGTYRVTFILNEVSKPSCGGVEAKTLLEETVDMTIAE